MAEELIALLPLTANDLKKAEATDPLQREFRGLRRIQALENGSVRLEATVGAEVLNKRIVTINATDANGDALTQSDLKMQLLDDDDQLVSNLGTVTVVSPTTAVLGDGGAACVIVTTDTNGIAKLEVEGADGAAMSLLVRVMEGSSQLLRIALTYAA